MEVVAIEPRDVHLLLDISLTELDHILNVLDAAEIDPKKCSAEAQKFVKEIFFSELEKLYMKLAEEKVNGPGLDSKRS